MGSGDVGDKYPQGERLNCICLYIYQLQYALEGPTGLFLDLVIFEEKEENRSNRSQFVFVSCVVMNEQKK